MRRLVTPTERRLPSIITGTGNRIDYHYVVIVSSLPGGAFSSVHR